jgi:hypothetical protein
MLRIDIAISFGLRHKTCKAQRLQSTATILITTEPRRCDGHWRRWRYDLPCLVLLLVDWISRREDAVIYRTGFSNQAGSLALRLWDKSNNLAHFRSKL